MASVEFLQQTTLENKCTIESSSFTLIVSSRRLAALVKFMNTRVWYRLRQPTSPRGASRAQVKHMLRITGGYWESSV